MIKLGKARTILNERFREIMPKKFNEKFGIEIETKWSMAEMAVYSLRTDGEPLTDEQRAFINAFEDGYAQGLIVLDELIG